METETKDNTRSINKYTCEVCCQELLIQNKNRHEKSKKHIKNFESKRGCPICYESFKSKREHEICKTCKNYWCKTCDVKINRCPFCREQIRQLPVNDDDTIIDNLIENMVNHITTIIQTVRNSNDTLYYHIYDIGEDSLVLNIYTMSDPFQLIQDIQDIQHIQGVQNIQIVQGIDIQTINTSIGNQN